MTRMRIVGLCIIALTTSYALTVTNASATEVLASSATGTFSVAGGGMALFGASEVKCTAKTAKYSFEDAHLGKFTSICTGASTNFLGTHSCSSSGAKEGEVVVMGAFHLGLARKVSAETAAAAFLLLVTPNAVFTCATLGTVEVKGSVIALLRNHANTAPLVPTENLLGAQIVYTSAKSAKQEHKEFLLSLKPGGVENPVDNAKLECNIFGFGFSECGLELTGEITAAAPTGLHLVNG